MKRAKVHVARDLSNLSVVEFPSWQTQTLALLGEDAFASTMLDASIGDPFDTSTPESALADLRESEEPGATFDPSQWLVVSDETGEIGALLPQVSEADLSSGTLSYLAEMPERRGQGFGRRLHQFGLQRLKKFGAVHYRGSIDTQNAPMLAIFSQRTAAQRPTETALI